MVLINWNSDMGDGWEHTYHPDYPTVRYQLYYVLAYPLGRPSCYSSFLSSPSTIVTEARSQSRARLV
jgi:hypothetical protein